jgi:hypothetical protein
MGFPDGNFQPLVGILPPIPDPVPCPKVDAALQQNPLTLANNTLSLK